MCQLKMFQIFDLSKLLRQVVAKLYKVKYVKQLIIMFTDILVTAF